MSESIDLRTMLVGCIEKTIASGVIETAAQKAIDKTVTSIVGDILREYSDFGKMIKEQVAKAFTVGDPVELPSYNDMVVKLVRQHVSAYCDGVLADQLNKTLKEILDPPPKEIKLSELIAKYVANAKDKSEGSCVCDGPGRVYVTMKESRFNSSYDGEFKYLRFSESEPKRSTYGHTEDAADIEIGLHKGEVFSLKFKNSDTEKQLFVGGLYNFERLVFNMKVSRTKVLIDCDPSDCDQSYAEGYDD